MKSTRYCMQCHGGIGARILTGRCRRGPRRERMAGIARIRGLNAWPSGRFGPEAATASGMPRASDTTCGLLPLLSRLIGFIPVSAPPFRTDGRRINDRRGPVGLAPVPEFVQGRAAQPAPQARLGPRREPAMRRRGRGAERRRQMPPGTTAGQHVHHSSEHRPLATRSGPTILRTNDERRQQRRDRLPELVRNQPLRQISAHDRS